MAKAIIIGAGIGGLTAALTLHEEGWEVEIHEAVASLQPLGVGINLLPHGARVLHGLALGDGLDEIAICTRAISSCRTRAAWRRASTIRNIPCIIKADGFETLTTHIFDPDDPYIESDAVFGVKESLLAEFRKVDDPARAKELGFEGPFFDVEHDFVLARG